MLEIENRELILSILTKMTASGGSLSSLWRGLITLSNRCTGCSASGAAVTSVKIDGVLHEFRPYPVVEDTTDIILNLKALQINTYTDECKTLRIEA